MASKNFLVVEFIASNELAVVPKSWVDEDYICTFPLKNASKLARKEIKVDKNWPQFNVHIICHCATYDIGVKKMKLVEKEESSSGAEKGRGYRKRKQTQFFKPNSGPRSDSGSSDSEISVSMPVFTGVNGENSVLVSGRKSKNRVEETVEESQEESQALVLEATSDDQNESDTNTQKDLLIIRRNAGFKRTSFENVSKKSTQCLTPTSNKKSCNFQLGSNSNNSSISADIVASRRLVDENSPTCNSISQNINYDSMSDDDERIGFQSRESGQSETSKQNGYDERVGYQSRESGQRKTPKQNGYDDRVGHQSRESGQSETPKQNGSDRRVSQSNNSSQRTTPKGNEFVARTVGVKNGILPPGMILVNEDWQRSVNRNLEIIKMNSNELQASVDAIMKKLNNEQAVPDSQIINFDFPLPLISGENLLNLEEKLQDSEFRKQLALYLKKIGGSNVTDTVKRVLLETMSDEVRVLYNWEGLKGKLKFKDLILAGEIVAAVLSSKSFECTKKDVESAIKSDLRHASARITAKISRTNS